MNGRTLLVPALAAILACATAIVHARADTLVDNIEGIRVTREGRVERFAAMLIDDAGRVKQVFAKGRKTPRKVDYRVDGMGRVLLPGFVDAHVSLREVGFAAIGLDLSGTTSLADAQTRIADYARRNPNKGWIVGRGWNAAGWELGRALMTADLDKAAPDRPVWLVAADGHSGWANSAALERAGITAATVPPPGGAIEGGLLSDTAMALVEMKLPPPTPEERDLAFRKAQEAMLARGVTAVSDIGTTLLDWQAIRREADYNRLSLRIAAYAAGIEDMVVIAGPAPTPWLYGDRLKLAGLSLVLDGGLATRGAWLLAPYADAADQIGRRRISGTQIRNLVSRAAMDEFQVSIAANGDAAVREALDVVTEMQGSYPGDRRWRIEGAALVSGDDLGRFAQVGAVAAVDPSRLSDLAMAQARLSPSAQVWPLRSLAAAGAPLAFGSGDPAPFAELSAAIARDDLAGQQALSREAALAAMTAGAAYAMAADKRFGSLAEGEWADFVLVTVDPLLAPLETLRQGRVLETWIAGHKVWSANGGQVLPTGGR